MDHIAQIAGKLADHQLDAMLLSSQAGERYAVGFHGEGLVLVTREGAHYSTDSRYIESAQKNLKGFEVVEIGLNNPMMQALKTTLDEFGVEALGF